MNATRLRLATTLFALMLHHSSLHADPPASAKPRLDLFGDPLPEGAIARMGTTRFRHDATSIAYLDAKTLVTAGDGVRFWDVATGKMIREWKAEHFGGDRLAALSGNGRVLISVTKQSSLRVWDTTTGKLLAERQKNAPERRGDAIVCLVVSRDGKRFASVREAEQVAWVWGLDRQKEICKFNVPPNDGRGILPSSYPITMSANGKAIASWTDRASIRDAESGKLIQTAKPDLDAIWTTAFSPDGSKLVVTGYAGLAVFDSSGKRLWNGSQQSRRWGAQFCPNGRTLVSTVIDPDNHLSAEIQILDAATGKMQRSWNTPMNWIAATAISPDSKTLATAGGGRLRLWNLADGKEIQKTPGHPNAICATCVSPDGHYVASADFDDSEVRLWEIATGKEVRRYRGHKNGCIGVVFSPNGKLLASSSGDQTVRVWDVATAREVCKFDGFPKPIWQLRFFQRAANSPWRSTKAAQLTSAM